MNELWRDQNMNGFSLELDWIPKDETIEDNDYQPYLKKKPYKFPNNRLLEKQEHEKDQEIHQDTEANQYS